MGSGLRVGLWLWGQGYGVRVMGSGLYVQGYGVRVMGSGLGSILKFRVRG